MRAPKDTQKMLRSVLGQGHGQWTSLHEDRKRNDGSRHARPLRRASVGSGSVWLALWHGRPGRGRRIRDAVNAELTEPQVAVAGPLPHLPHLRATLRASAEYQAIGEAVEDDPALGVGPATDDEDADRKEL